MSNIYLLSDRGLHSSVSYDPLFELEDIIVESCAAKLLSPKPTEAAQWVHRQPKLIGKYVEKVVRRTAGLSTLSEDILATIKKPNILIVGALCGANLALLTSIPNWRERFDKVVAYIFDAWSPEIYPAYTRQLDHIFVPMPELIPSLQAYFGVPVSLIPFGVDGLRQGSYQIERPFDLVSYGRIPIQFNQAFAKFNQPGTGRLYYRSTPRSAEIYPTLPYEERRDTQDRKQLFKILRRSKVAIAFDTLYPGMRQFPYSFVTLRWFECGAAGCVIVGKRPTTPLAQELLDWEDATIELPDDPEASVRLIEELWENPARLHAIYRRNYVENLTRHDWRWRIKTMLDQLEIALPESLIKELSQLQKVRQLTQV